MAAKQRIGSDEMAVMVFALRYAVRRRTYAPALVCDHIKASLPRMTGEQKHSLVAELDSIISYGECIDNLAEEAVSELLGELVKEVADV